jgi:transposase
VDRDTVSEWLNRWEVKGMSGLIDAQRSGRPRKSKEAENEEI